MFAFAPFALSGIQFIMSLYSSFDDMLGPCDSNGSNNASGKAKVIFAQDGSVDDYMGTIILAEMHKKKKIDFLGEIVLNGDSVLPYSMEITYKFHALLGIADIPVLLSKARMYNAFPYCYRRDTMNLANIDTLAEFSCPMPKEPLDGDEWLREQLQSAGEKSITYVCTASLTNLADVLQSSPELERKIGSIIWMAGAINVKGNLDREIYKGWNDKAEWNVFADPLAASWIFEHTAIEMNMFPLDIADKAPVDGQFMIEVEQQTSRECSDPNRAMLNDIVYKAYKDICVSQPYYRLWDTVAVAFLAMPELYASPERMQLAVVTTSEQEGWTAVRGSGVESSYWREVKVFMDFSSDQALEKFIHLVATHTF